MWKDWVNTALGAFMAFLPWYIEGLNASQQPVIVYNCAIAGGLIAILSVCGIIMRGRTWPEWITVFLGLWLVLAPGTLSYQSSAMTWINVIAGLIIATFASWQISDKKRQQPPRPYRETPQAVRRLQDCTISERLFYTAFLLLMSAGYLMALTFLYLTHQGLDGKPGLSVADIADSYYGNRSGTRLEDAIRGPMAPHIQPEERHHVIAWLKSGASEKGYVSIIKPIVDKDCIICHSPASGLKIPDLTTYEGVHAVSKVDTGASILSLVRLSHIHLFGIGLIAFGLGFIFRMATVRLWVKNLLLLMPFIAIFVDISTWFLTKWDPIYAYTVITSGILLGLAWAAQIFISLYQMWIVRSRSTSESFVGTG